MMMMTTKLLSTFVLLLTILSISCSHTTNCKQLTNTFSTYDEALLQIESAHFEVSESANTSKSSWIKNAFYYSCDGKKGYFVLETRKKQYLYSNLPYTVWKQFENSESFGKFYHEEIKHKYLFQLMK